MSKFIELKSENFKMVNVDSIKTIKQSRNYTILRYIFKDGDEFIEKFDTEEELQERIQVVRSFLMDEITLEEYMKIWKEEREKTKAQINKIKADIDDLLNEALIKRYC